MPGKPKKGSGYGGRSKKCIGRKFKAPQKKVAITEEKCCT